jgi:hypothetical protein
MKTAFPLDAKVRFTQERLAVLTPRDRQGLDGRIGVIQTDGNLVRKPTVYFSADGTKLDIRLFRVDPRHLELVENPPATEIAPSQTVVKPDPASDLTEDTAHGETSTPDGGGNLSQSELDDLFG